MDPQDVTSLLGINPTKSQVAGESRVSGTRQIVNKLSGWFLSSEGLLSSRDCRDHLDWLLAKLDGKDDAGTPLRPDARTFPPVAVGMP